MPNAGTEKTVFVLGATSRVGRLLQRYWFDNPPENYNILWLGRRKAPDVSQMWIPGGDVESLPQCDAVVSLWGPVAGSPKVLSDNTFLAKEAQRIARFCGADRVLHASTAAVYSPTQEPVSEDGETSPRNDYGRSKIEMEQSVAHEIPKPVLMRMANIVGAGSLFTSLASPDDVTLVQFDGEHGPIRSHLRISTFAACVEALLSLDVVKLPQRLNVADYPALDMAEIVAAAGKRCIWKPAPEGMLPMMDFDLTRLRETCPGAFRSATADQIVDEWRRLRIPE